MSDNQHPTLMVTGASGQMGQRVLELLLEAGASNILAATRTPEKLARFAERGVTLRHADFDDEASLLKAFSGVDRLLLISTDAVGQPGYRLKQHQTAVKAAEQAGVQHIIYTSLINPVPTSPIAIAPDHYGTEQALENTKLAWTVLRNSVYTEYQTASLARAIQSGQLFSACADGKVSYVSREDCSRAAAAALNSTFAGRRTLDITGPASISQADLAEIASRISGKPVTYIPLTQEALIQGMVSAGLPQPAAELYASFDAGIAEGFLDVESTTVEMLTGRKPISVADYMATQREALLGVEAVH